ncbi:hypothetical protein ABT099_23450 [Streptomyces prasinus]
MPRMIGRHFVDTAVATARAVADPYADIARLAGDPTSTTTA